MDLPLPAVFVPPQGFHLGAESRPLAQSVLVRKSHQVGLVLRTLRVVAGPIGVHVAGQRVVRRRRVDADAGIGRGQPRAADFGVAIEDLVGDSGVGSGECGDDSRKTRSDDGDRHRLRNRHGARQRRLRQLEAALFEQQRDELFVDLGAQGNRQQPPEEPGVVGGQRTVGPRPLERLDDSRHKCFRCVRVDDACPFGWVGHMGDRRPETIDHRCVASELSQHRDEHTGVGLAQVGPQFMRINIVGAAVVSASVVTTVEYRALDRHQRGDCLLSGTVSCYRVPTLPTLRRCNGCTTTTDHRAFAELAGDFAAKEVAPHIAGWEVDGIIPARGVRQGRWRRATRLRRRRTLRRSRHRATSATTRS